MRLNSLFSTPGSRVKKTRKGRGIGSGLGKTSGKGHKGQKARAGGSVKAGFEGGQMPLQRRLPKFGFNSRKAKVTDEVRVVSLSSIQESDITLDTLKKYNLISNSIKDVKIFGTGELDKSFNIKGMRVSKGARLVIEKAGGTIA